MPRTQTAAEYNTFVKGLITEASPLNFPEGASLDEDNMILNSDGSRQRRRGMDLEENSVEITTAVTAPATGDIAYSSFKWANAGGDAEKSISVIQVGNELRFFDLDSEVISNGLITSKVYATVNVSQVFSYAIVDGLLVTVTGQKDLSIFEYDSSAGTITETTDILYIRDLFGVEDVIGGVDLKELSNVEVRPTTNPDPHLYNLRNQTWAIPRRNGNTETLTDPINAFFGNAAKYPSNADTVIPYLHADPNDTDNRTIDRFFPEELKENPPGTSRSPIGYFIIDAMERGASRIVEEAALRTRYSLSYSVSTLPVDKTPGGPSVVAEFSGRVWFGGFSAELEGGDAKSPRMSSYLLFSRLVEDSSDINKCYQSGDPTTNITPDIIDTDGGFLRIDGAYGIQKLISAGNSLLVVASNGVWRIYGGNDSGFTSTSYVVSKISDNGCRGKGSIVPVENTVVFWGDDGIYHVKPNEFGDWDAQSVTQTTIQSLYDDIDIEDKNLSQGYYDKFERKIRWIYRNRIGSSEEVRELIFDINLAAFYTNTIKEILATSIPKVVSIFEREPFKLVTGISNITSNADNVTSNTGADNVIITVGNRTTVTRQLGYVILTSVSPVVKFTLGLYRNDDYLDFKSVDNVGADAAAFLTTGYITAGDTQRYKQVPYLTTHFRRTETGFEDDGSGGIIASNQSSCMVQAQWEWANSENSGRWGREFQAYRYKRHYIPSDVSDSYDYGFSVITSKSKLRGKGKSLSMKFSTEAGKDLHLYGWALLLGVTGNV